MLKIFILILSALNMQAKTAAAKPAEPDVKKSTQREVKTQKSKRAENLERVAQEVQAGSQMLPEVASLVAQYEGRTTVVEEATHAALKTLREFCELVRSNMPTREQLSMLSYGEGKGFQAAVVPMRESILDTLLMKVATPEHIEEWQQLRKMLEEVNTTLVTKHQPAYEDYKSQAILSGVVFPFTKASRDLWAAAGFKFAPKVIKRSYMQCDACGSAVLFVMPWQRPQYYHKSDCKTLAAQLADPVRAPHMKIVAYGQEVPEDPEEYWHYTMGFLERYIIEQVLTPHSASHGRARAAWQLLAYCCEMTGWEMAARYIESYDPSLDEATRKALYNSLDLNSTYFYELWAL